MEENSKPNVIFNISGSTVQIAPNATTQQQIFYDDQLAEHILHSEGKASETLTEDEQRLAIYINKVDSLTSISILIESGKPERKLFGRQPKKQPRKSILCYMVKYIILLCKVNYITWRSSLNIPKRINRG